MKLLVRVIEARSIPALDPNGYSNPYVKLQLGKQKFRSEVVKKCSNPTWCEEFTFKVDDLKEELIVSVLDEDKYFNDDIVGQIKVPVNQVFEADGQTLGTGWHTMLPKNKKSKNRPCGEILLTICISQNSTEFPSGGDPGMLLKKYATSLHKSRSVPSYCQSSYSSSSVEEVSPSKSEKLNSSSLAGRIANIFNKNVDTSFFEASDMSVEHESADPVDLESKSEEQSSSVDFDELMRTLEMNEQGGEVPNSLPGGIVVNQLYGVTPAGLNSIIFSPNSSFWKSAAEAMGNTEFQLGSWKFENGSKSLKRVVSYTKAPTKMIRALKAIEDQTYLKADGKNFVVLANVDTPDAPYGKTFRAEVLYCITPGPEQPSGELSSQLVVSWRINFLQSTMMKGMIESGARQGIKESFEQYAKVLRQNVKPLDLKDIGSEREKLLASLQVEHQSDLTLAVQYLANLTVISTAFMGLYLLAHLWLAMPSTAHGLEFVGLDLPDSVGELVVSGVMFLLGKRAFESISQFMLARMQKASDHGIKGRGEGWLLTVALIEGRKLTAADSSGLLDPYVVFTCNGNRRTSSIKFQNSKPLWNEIFEFDAMDEPPSMLGVEVFSFDWPSAAAKSLGHAEINFLKSSISDLSDIWIPIGREMDQACQSKLYLRIFLNNTKGSDIVKDYIAKVEKEIGKKIKLRSPQTNSAFQKLFRLPPEEFLINDFVCNLKRKMPHQGRLFVSPRIVGFHADLFGQKIKFFFLWENIENIEVVPPSLSSMGSPIMIMTLRPGRGCDARHGARAQDPEGRLKFHFHSFVSFNVAHRTIIALWKARALTPMQKAQSSDEESDSNACEESMAENLQPAVDEPDSKSHPGVDEEYVKIIQNEESVSPQEAENINMSMIYSSVLSLPVSFFMELFSGSELDKRVMEKAGCLNYTHTPWESEKHDIHQRHLHYTLDKLIPHDSGDVSSTQQKLLLPDGQGWLIEEIMTLNGFVFSDYFTIHLKYLVEALPSKSSGCSIQVYLGVSWKKSIKQHKKITKNIMSNMQKRLRVIASSMEKEYMSGQ